MIVYIKANHGRVLALGLNQSSQGSIFKIIMEVALEVSEDRTLYFTRHREF